MGSPLIASLNAAGLVTSTNLEGVKQQYLTWCNSKPIPELAADALSGVAGSSKYPATVIRNANVRYDVLHAAGETGSPGSGGGGGGLDETAVQALIEDYAAPAAAFADLGGAAAAQALISDGLVFRPTDLPEGGAGSFDPWVWGTSGAGTGVTWTPSGYVQEDDLAVLVMCGGTTTVPGGWTVQSDVNPINPASDNSGGNTRVYTKRVGSTPGADETGISFADNAAYSTWAVVYLRQTDRLGAAAKIGGPSAATVVWPAVAADDADPVLLICAGLVIGANGPLDVPTAYAHKVQANNGYTSLATVVTSSNVETETKAHPNAQDYGFIKIPVVLT